MAISTQTDKELKSLITPALLTHIAEASSPFSKTEPLNFADVVSGSRDDFKKACENSTARDALIALSRLSPDATIPSELDLMSFLPLPSSPEFPQQCFGLQLVLDQASRLLFGGIDGRWQSGYFGPLARQLAGQWYALPEAQRPNSWARWRDDVGVSSYGYWLTTQIMWAAPFLHAEDLESQKIGLKLSEEIRTAVEAHTGVDDPYRATRDALLKNDKAFLAEVGKGPPMEEDKDGDKEGEKAKGSISMSTWAFWWCMVLDAHWPIIEHFGRYPYRNAILGRDSTEKEKEWLHETDPSSEAPSDVAKRIRADIEKGIWTPLGEE